MLLIIRPNRTVHPLGGSGRVLLLPRDACLLMLLWGLFHEEGWLLLFLAPPGKGVQPPRYRKVALRKFNLQVERWGTHYSPVSFLNLHFFFQVLFLPHPPSPHPTPTKLCCIWVSKSRTQLCRCPHSFHLPVCFSWFAFAVCYFV